MSGKLEVGTLVHYNGTTWEVSSSYETTTPSGRSEVWFYTTKNDYYEPFRMSRSVVVRTAEPSSALSYMELFL